MPSSQNESPQENVSRRGLLFGWLKKTTPEGYQEEPIAQNAESPIEEKKRISRRDANALLGGGALAAGLALTTGCGSKGFDYREPEVVKKGDEPSREEMLKGKPEFIPSKTWLGWDSTTRNSYRKSQGIAYQEGKVNKVGDPIGTARLEPTKVEEPVNEAGYQWLAFHWHTLIEVLAVFSEKIRTNNAIKRQMRYGSNPGVNAGSLEGEESLAKALREKYTDIQLKTLSSHQLSVLLGEVERTGIRVRQIQRDIHSKHLAARVFTHLPALINDIIAIGHDLGIWGGAFNPELLRTPVSVGDIALAYGINKLSRVFDEKKILADSADDLTQLKLHIQEALPKAETREKEEAERVKKDQERAEEQRKKDEAEQEKREEKREKIREKDEEKKEKVGEKKEQKEEERSREQRERRRQREDQKKKFEQEKEMKKLEAELERQKQQPKLWTPDQGTPPK